MSGSETWPKKVELMHAHSIKYGDYREYFTHNIEVCICSYDNQPYGSNIYY